MSFLIIHYANSHLKLYYRILHDSTSIIIFHTDFLISN